MRSAAVRTRDRVDDRKAETGPAACARSVRAAETLKRVIDELDGNPGSLVGDVQLQLFTVASRKHPHRAVAMA